MVFLTMPSGHLSWLQWGLLRSFGKDHFFLSQEQTRTNPSLFGKSPLLSMVESKSACQWCQHMDCAFTGEREACGLKPCTANQWLWRGWLLRYRFAVAHLSVESEDTEMNVSVFDIKLRLFFTSVLRLQDAATRWTISLILQFLTFSKTQLQ